MTVLRFTLSCTPTAQARVRHTVRCGHSVAYKSAGQKSAKAVLDDLLSARAPEKLEDFKTRWIPKEETYFAHFQIPERCEVKV